MLGAVLALMGLILLALPTTVLGMEFQKAYFPSRAVLFEFSRCQQP